MREPSPLENDERYVNTHHHLRRQRWVKVIEVILGLVGTVATAGLGFAAKLIGANQPPVTSTTNNVTVNERSDVWTGLKVIARAAATGDLRQTATASKDVAAAPDPKPGPPSPGQQDGSDAVSKIPDATCVGFDQRAWSASASEADVLVGKDGSAYSVTIALRNRTSDVQFATFDGNPYLIDNAGNNLALAPSIFGGRWGDAGTRVAPGAALEINYVSVRTAQPLGTKISSLSNTLVLSAQDGQGKVRPPERIALNCHGLPVAKVATAALGTEGTAAATP